MGTRRHCRSATTPRPTSCGTARATAGSSMPLTASPLELLQYVPLDDPIKISRLTIRNTSARTRRLSVTAYVEWVLGPSRDRVRAVRRDRDRSRHRRDVRAQSMECGIRLARRVRRPGRAADRLDRRPAGVHRPQRHAGKPGRTCAKLRHSPGRWAPASIPAARCKPRWGSMPAKASRSSFSSARPPPQQTRNR